MVQETITSNVHDDIITLEFQRTDGTLITQLIDFRSVSINVERLSWWSNISCARPFLRLTMPISTMPSTVEKMSNFLNYVRCCSALLYCGASCSLFIAHKQWGFSSYTAHTFFGSSRASTCADSPEYDVRVEWMEISSHEIVFFLFYCLAFFYEVVAR